MQNKIHYSMEAKRDLDGIWDYIVSDLCNPAAAARMVDQILDDVDRLADFPGLGTPLSAIADTDANYRYLITGSYMTFYRVQGNDIYVDLLAPGENRHFEPGRNRQS